MTAVVIVVPVLNRPQNVAPLIESIEQATPEPHRTLFVANEDDSDELAALVDAGVHMLVVPPERRSWACKINDGIRATSEPWIFAGADDVKFHRDWFSRALEWAGDGMRVIGTNDLWNPRVMCGQHSTHTLVARSYIDEHGAIDQPGVLVHEGYGHDYADDEMVATAMHRGQYVHAFDAIVEHLRPKDIAEEDATYRLGRSMSRQGKMLFQRRRRMWA